MHPRAYYTRLHAHIIDWGRAEKSREEKRTTARIGLDSKGSIENILT